MTQQDSQKEERKEDKLIQKQEEGESTLDL
jgi:hypothetical protein